MELAAYELIRRLLTESEIMEALSLGWIEPLIDEVLADHRLDPILRSYEAAINTTIVGASHAAALDMPRLFRSSVFNILNPSVLDAASQVGGVAISRVKTNVRELVREAGIDAIRAGQHPRTAAREIRSMLGLAPNQRSAIENFRSMLERGDRTALTRTLRDKRYDPTLRKALGARGTGLSRTQVEAMTTAYRRRMIAHNAETQALSIAFEAQKRGQRIAWLDAVDRGVIPRAALWRRWRGVDDSRRRESHEAMEGEEAHVDQTYSNGQTVPGDDEYRCRCIDVFYVKREFLRVAA